MILPSCSIATSSAIFRTLAMSCVMVMAAAPSAFTWATIKSFTASAVIGSRPSGGVAGNVVPDAAEVDVNFRFAPDRTVDQAVDHVREVVDGLGLGFEVTDASPGALPGLAAPAAAALVDAAGGRYRAKYGWTDVSRFSALGIPAVNYGPGDPNLAHKRDERVPTEQITAVTAVLRGYLEA